MSRGTALNAGCYLRVDFPIQFLYRPFSRCLKWPPPPPRLGSSTPQDAGGVDRVTNGIEKKWQKKKLCREEQRLTLVGTSE